LSIYGDKQGRARAGWPGQFEKENEKKIN